MHSVRSPFHLALVAIAAPLLALGCTETAEQPSNEPVAANAVEAEPAEIIKPRAPLGREQLIIAALRAATAAALGQDDAAGQSELKGNRFELRLRFGCSSASPEAATGWTYDEKEKVLRVRVRADVDAEQVETSDLLGAEYEGAVGFTLRRPWMLTDGCPDQDFAPMAEGPAITLVQLFTGSDSRVQRPETSYETVTPMEPQDVPSQGLNLVVAGRLEALPDGRPIHCAAAKGSPACIVSVLIDRVAIEDPARAAILGEWGAS